MKLFRLLNGKFTLVTTGRKNILKESQMYNLDTLVLVAQNEQSILYAETLASRIPATLPIELITYTVDDLSFFDQMIEVVRVKNGMTSRTNNIAVHARVYNLDANFTFAHIFNTVINKLFVMNFDEAYMSFDNDIKEYQAFNRALRTLHAKAKNDVCGVFDRRGFSVKPIPGFAMPFYACEDIANHYEDPISKHATPELLSEFDLFLHELPEGIYLDYPELKAVQETLK